jgi:hypothetical protein
MRYLGILARYKANNNDYNARRFDDGDDELRENILEMNRVAEGLNGNEINHQVPGRMHHHHHHHLIGPIMDLTKMGTWRSGLLLM